MVQRSGVLIETYWNVKAIAIAVLVLPHPVLIETYWNVKSIHVEEPFQIAGINRNILECKVYGSGFGIHATTLY